MDTLPVASNQVELSVAFSKSLGAGYDLNIGDELFGNNKIYTVVGFEAGNNYVSIVLERRRSYEAPVERRERFDRDSFRRDSHYGFMKIEGNFEDLEAEALDKLANPPLPPEDDKQTTALTIFSAPERLQQAYRAAEIAARHEQLLHKIIESKLNALRKTYDALQSQASILYRILRAIETYTGVHQALVTIRDGSPAPASEPVSIRQLVLYMDEEVGSIELDNDGETVGLDFRHIETFDKWLLSGGLDVVAPESKCVVAFKPSRQPRDYGWNSSADRENRMTYLLIRNGTQVHRIWTALSTPDRLFPSIQEYQEIYDTKTQANISNKFINAQRAADIDFTWKEMVLLIQGIIERSDVLKPYPAPYLSIMNPADLENGHIRLIRDGEARLGDGHLPFSEWRTAHNAKLQRGSRVVVHIASSRSGDDWKYRFSFYRNNYPTAPTKGVYTIEEVMTVEDEKSKSRYSDTLKILYDPGDWSWQSERRCAFYLYRNDDFILSYDTPSLEDVEYYIYNRVERRNYLNVLPTLYVIREARRAELKAEREFVALLAGKEDLPEDLIWCGVAWWKTKVISTRAISSDDAKAWRMIISYVRRNKES